MTPTGTLQSFVILNIRDDRCHKPEPKYQKNTKNCPKTCKKIFFAYQQNLTVTSISPGSRKSSLPTFQRLPKATSAGMSERFGKNSRFYEHKNIFVVILVVVTAVTFTQPPVTCSLDFHYYYFPLTLMGFPIRILSTLKNLHYWNCVSFPLHKQTNKQIEALRLRKKCVVKQLNFSVLSLLQQRRRRI